MNAVTNQTMNDVGQFISAAPSKSPGIYQRLNAVMREVRGVEKSSVNTHARYKYAGHQAVNDAIRDSFVRHGIVQIATVTGHCVSESGTVIIDVRVSWVSADDASSRVDMDCVGIQPAQTKEKTVTAQQVGQAISYAVKCAQFKGLMLRGDNEEDSDAGHPDGPRDSAGNSAGDGPAHDSHGPEDASEDYAARDLAVNYLAQFAECKTADQVKVVNDNVKARWNVVRVVPNFAEHMVKARAKALARIRDAANDYHADLDAERDGR